jgi:hypothetical protein
MANFPKSEPEVVTLAQAMVTGLTGQEGVPPVFPAPPVLPQNLELALTTFTTARDAAMTAEAQAKQATESKNNALTQLVTFMKTDLHYAEDAVNEDDALLALIGWSGRRAPTPLQPAGQALLLEVRRQGEGSLELTWKTPIDGGKVSAYRVYRRERPEGPWVELTTVFETEDSLTDQPRGKEYEYRVIAANKAGDGEPSNTVMVVL